MPDYDLWRDRGSSSQQGVTRRLERVGDWPLEHANVSRRPFLYQLFAAALSSKIHNRSVPGALHMAGKHQIIENANADGWDRSSGGAEIGADEARVWHVSLDQNAETIANLAMVLSLDERQRAERFYRPIDRRRFIAGCGILRKILSAYLRLTPDELRFTYNEYG